MLRGAWGLQIEKGQIALCRIRQHSQGLTVKESASHPLPPGLVIPSFTEPLGVLPDRAEGNLSLLDLQSPHTSQHVTSPQR